MSNAQVTRRDFVLDSGRAATAGWLSLQLPWLAALAGCARREAALHLLSSDEAATLRAFASRILPSEEGSPGAEEAGAVYFIDRALAQPFFADKVPVIRAGIADLDARARTVGGRVGFAALAAPQQIAVMKQIERSPFFTEARTLVIIGTFADSSHGGNKDGTGWALLQMEHKPIFTAPFGWYDAPHPDEPSPHTT